MTVALHNVYPCYFNEISIYALNTGTIPLKFEKVIISSDYDSQVLDWIDTSYAPVPLDCDNDDVPDIEIKWGDHIGAQLHQGEETPEMSFFIHVFQTAPQGETLYFTIELDAIQYNKSKHP